MNNEQKLQDIKSQMQELRQQAKNVGQKFFTESSQEIFNRFPTLESFGWHQYTPYFCDGEACYFSVNSDQIYINLIGQDEREDNGEYDEGFSAPWKVTKEEIDVGKRMDKVAHIINVETGEETATAPEDYYLLKEDYYGGYGRREPRMVPDYNRLNPKYRTEARLELVDIPVEEQIAFYVTELLETTGDDLLLEMFDDHVQITVNRNGEISTDGYEHD